MLRNDVKEMPPGFTNVDLYFDSMYIRLCIGHHAFSAKENVARVPRVERRDFHTGAVKYVQVHDSRFAIRDSRL